MNACLRYVTPHILLFPSVFRTLIITRTSSNILRLSRFNSSTGTEADVISEISIANPSQPSTSADNTLAYRPNYADYHQSGFAGVFLNLEKIFPCGSTGDKTPLCSVFTYDEDGFRKGKAIIEAQDNGYAIRVFTLTNNSRHIALQFKAVVNLMDLIVAWQNISILPFPVS